MLGKLKKPLYWIGIFVIAGLASAIGKEIAGKLWKPSDGEVLATGISEAVREMNARAPMKVDEYTTLLRAEQAPNNRVVIHYELSRFDEWGSPANLADGQAFVIKSVCAKPNTLKTLRMGATYDYVYQKENGQQVYRFSIDRSTCR